MRTVKKSFFEEKLLLVILGFFANFPIEFIGVLKLSEIICLVHIIFNFTTVVKIVLSNKYVRYYTGFIFLWLSLGIISSSLNNTEEISLYKGIANILFIEITFLSFFIILRDDFTKIIFFLIPYGLGSILFNPFSYSLDNQLDFFTGWQDKESENFFDIFVAPIVNPMVLAFTILYHKRNNIIILVTLLYGIMAIIYDAKSVGFVFFMAALTYWLKKLGVKFSLKQIRYLIIVGTMSMFFIVYTLANNNLLGQFSSKTISQYLTTTEKFNPFLIIGRPEPTVGVIAIADQPLLGHGFNKQEPKYTQLAKTLGYLPYDIYFRENVGIPNHSCLLQSMLDGGVFAATVWLFMLSTSIKALSIVYKQKDSIFSMIMIISFFYMFWNILFSSFSRIDFAYFFSMIVIFVKTFSTQNTVKYTSIQ